MAQEQSEILTSEVTNRGTLRRLLHRIGRCLLFVLIFYATIVVIGLIPLNNDFRPADSGVRILVTSNPVHADLVLPLSNKIVDWRDYFPESSFPGDTSPATHVAIGWGDRGFFLETPTWGDLTFGNAANALFWPSASCMHVTMKSRPVSGPDTRSVNITPEQYRRLVDFVLAKFKSSGGQLHQVADAHYAQNDAFFEAHGAYHCLNTCNSWVGDGLATSGVRVGWLTPLPKTVFLYLPDQI